MLSGMRGEIALILELCQGDELLERLNRERAVGVGWDEHRAGHYVRTMLLAVRFCHDHGIVHRDLKASAVDDTVFTRVASNRAP